MSNEEIARMLIQGLLGKPYHWGGSNGIEGFDCSGFVQEMHEAQGQERGPDCNAQGFYERYKGRPAAIPEFGTLAFYGKSVSSVSHIVFCLNSTLMFEFGGGDSTTKTLQDAINRNAFGRIRPIKRRKDFLICLNPQWTWIAL